METEPNVPPPPKVPHLKASDVLGGTLPLEDPRRDRYFAMYSSVLGGVVTDPRLMTIPLDDHLVHRGDGVFETFVIVGGKVYQLDAHLARLKRSAELAGLPFPATEAEIRLLLLETSAVAQAREAVLRIFLSRGTGGFSVSPGECPQRHIYIIVTAPDPIPTSFHLHGMKVITSRVPLRDPAFAEMKGCNYQPNALLELEASQAGADSALWVDEEGHLAEGSNKNVAIVTRDRVFKAPPFRRALRGTTLLRVLDLARKLQREGVLAGVEQSEVSREEAYRAAEMMFLGTSLRVVPIVMYDGQPIGEGRPGPVTRALGERLEEDMRHNENLLTPIPYHD